MLGCSTLRIILCSIPPFLRSTLIFVNGVLSEHPCSFLLLNLPFRQKLFSFVNWTANVKYPKGTNARHYSSFSVFPE